MNVMVGKDCEFGTSEGLTCVEEKHELLDVFGHRLNGHLQREYQ